jgi:short subunit fatty acids transporter
MEPHAGTTSIARTVAMAITDIRMLVDVRIVWDSVYLNRKGAAHFFVGAGSGEWAASGEWRWRRR